MPAIEMGEQTAASQYYITLWLQTFPSGSVNVQTLACEQQEQTVHDPESLNRHRLGKPVTQSGLRT
jgi:hypothetical protein